MVPYPTTKHAHTDGYVPRLIPYDQHRRQRALPVLAVRLTNCTTRAAARHVYSLMLSDGHHVNQDTNRWRHDDTMLDAQHIPPHCQCCCRSNMRCTTADRQVSSAAPSTLTNLCNCHQRPEACAAAILPRSATQTQTTDTTWWHHDRRGGKRHTRQCPPRQGRCPRGPWLGETPPGRSAAPADGGALRGAEQYEA